MSKIKTRVLSGIQPSGNLHLGNYFGMMSKMINYQEKNDLFCFIADYHALTSNPNPKILSLNTYLFLYFHFTEKQTKQTGRAK